jgi:hypothetical protein
MNEFVRLAVRSRSDVPWQVTHPVAIGPSMQRRNELHVLFCGRFKCWELAFRIWEIESPRISPFPHYLHYKSESSCDFLWFDPHSREGSSTVYFVSGGYLVGGGGCGGYIHHRRVSLASSSSSLTLSVTLPPTLFQLWPHRRMVGKSWIFTWVHALYMYTPSGTTN